MASTAAPSAGAAPPPTAAEIQRKLSVHAQSPPSHRRRTSLSKSPTIALPAAFSGAESDTDAGALSPTAAHTSFDFSSPQPPQPASLPAQPQQQAVVAPLASIAERPGGSGEDSDDDDDDDWHPTAGRSIEEFENLNEENMAKEGYLFKKGERRKTWKKRWFVLRQTQLSYYKSNKEYKLLRLLPVSEIHCVTPVTLKKHINTFGIITPARTYYVQAESAAEADSWVRALNEARARVAVGQPAPDGRKPAPVPPTINVQRSMPINIQGGPEPKTPPPQGFSVSPSSPSNHQQHLTSSDSEDQDTYAPTSPVIAASGTALTAQAGDRDPNKVIAQGYLMKCGAKRKNWRKRWFVLTSDRLLYAKSHMDINSGKPTKKDKYVPVSAILDAVECTVPKQGLGLGLGAVGDRVGSVPVGTSTSMPGALGQAAAPAAATMAHSATANTGATQPGANLPPSTSAADGPQLPHTFKIVTTKRAMLLCAPSEEEEIKWLSAVRALIARRAGNNPAETTGTGAVRPNPLTSSPNNKRLSRRDLNTSGTSGSPPRTSGGGEFVIPQSSSGRRKDSTSLAGVAATAMAIPAGTA